MSLVNKLIGYGLRQVIGEAAEQVVECVERLFNDHSQTLTKALTRANDRTWQALGIALAGDGFLDQVKVFFASGDDKGIREQVRPFLQSNTVQFEGCPAGFRKACLTELKAAQKIGFLSAQKLSSKEIAHQTASFNRYSDPKGLVDGAEQVVAQIAEGLAKEFPNLGKLLKQHTSGSPPLVVAAFAYFFRREVETDDELAHGLFFDGLRQLSASQGKAFSEVGKALTSLGGQFEQVFEQLDVIEKVVVETQTVAIATHGTVLDMQGELQRLGSLHLANSDEVRRLLQDVLNRVSQAGMQKGEVKPQHSFSIRSEDERAAVKQLLEDFRQLPTEKRRQLPALQNGLGKLQVGTGDFAGASQTFGEVAQIVTDASAQAEAHFNSYRAALEEKKWDRALDAISQAARLDAQRFAPFPMERYQPKRILGAGGFGTAFLCHDRNFNEDVVVKTLHAADMERSMEVVFQEARILRSLSHSAIIGVHDCEYADPKSRARPYIVMGYFPGGSLEDFIQHSGTLSAENMLVVARQIAQGMQAAHQQNILHRDLKPDNVLVRKEGDSWQVKIIDFGLALRKQTIETSMARSAGNTILNVSVAGTVKYAPPEQMGEMKGVQPGPYSDVYSFGKMCCHALFKTTEPRSRQWAEIPIDLAQMLEKCIEQSLDHRPSSFEPVLAVLEALDPNKKAEPNRKSPALKATVEQSKQRTETRHNAATKAWETRRANEERRQQEEARHNAAIKASETKRENKERKQQEEAGHIGDPKETPGSPKDRQWDETAFFDTLTENRGADEAGVALSLLNWAKKNSLRIWWGKGSKDGSFFPMIDWKGTHNFLISIWTSGRVEVQFQWMKERVPFDDETKRQELRNRLNLIPGVGIPVDAIGGRPRILLSTLTNKDSLEQFLAVLDWFLQELKVT